MRYLKGLLAAAVFALALPAALAQASAWPDRPVKMIVPFPPGGTADILGRFLAQSLSTHLGKAVVVENKSGAGGLIGADFVAKAAPDGYTLLMSSAGPLGVALALYPKVPYDILKDFAPVAMVAEAQMVLVSNPEFKAHTLKELVDLSKAKPMEVRAAINATGSMHHLMTEMFATHNGTKFTMVPYRGSGPAIMDMLAGHIDLDVENLPAVAEYVKLGKLRAIATLGAERAPQLPDVPTFKELGYPEFVAAPWFALVAPANTPAAIVGKLNQAVNASLAGPDAKEWLAKQGANAVPGTPQQAADKIRSETVRWAEIVKKTGVKAD
ncbi:Argininosuccinate lyase (plasmid) [Variovorax sp. SRS16]|uniref:Bug family tripartite tricarboxylate transporter substrate binding protein n=1 Tax=Variovorax sp. SRS16 TaxID=282217 RepID=UPI001318644A|nr:tripartite tricarboxylate transporter substrate binding protein [Variovorax sp. SRS16]VTU46309.1 Argininosuccinate lyase [Variovorax sp. SRS16]